MPLSAFLVALAWIFILPLHSTFKLAKSSDSYNVYECISHAILLNTRFLKEEEISVSLHFKKME